MSRRAAPPLKPMDGPASPVNVVTGSVMVSPDDYHRPVLVEEALEYLQPESGGAYVDATVGGGGHTEAILRASAPDGRLVGVDRDPEAVEAARARLSETDIDSGRWEIRLANYADVDRILREIGIGQVDGLLLDAGVSSRQLDAADRGFSVQQAGPLDMRMGPDAPELRDVLARATVDDLAEWLRDFGDVRGARRCARAIKEAFDADELETTLDLADVARDHATARRGTDPAILVFQALRMAVNRELEHLERAIQAFPDVVRPAGRGVFISFHSHEDRTVKHGLRDLATDCVCPPDLPVCGCDAVARVRVLTSSPIRPAEAEVEENPRARSARLRAAEVLE